jgi:hypothetical protein
MYKKILNNKNIELESLLSHRVPPFFWDLIGYLFGLLILCHKNNQNLIIFGGIIVSIYGTLNIIFDMFTYSNDFTNNKLPTYDNLNFYNFMIVNKKCNLKIKLNSIDRFSNECNLSKNYNKTEECVENTHNSTRNLKLELNFYVGKSETMEMLLNYIYLFGITKKNYTQIDLDVLSDFEDPFI